MGATQDRWDRELEERSADFQDAHEAGEHKDDPEPDCGGCYREMREGLNVEGDPTRNGALDKW